MAPTPSKRTMLTRCAALLLGACAAGIAWAQDAAWPARPITIISTSAAGTGSDALARAMAQRLAAQLKQPIVVDNRPGASGVIAFNAVIKAPKDGYTLLYSIASNTVIWPAVAKSVPYDVTRDLVPVAQTAAGGVVLLVNSDVPAKNLAELVALAKAHPEKYNSYGSWAVGSSGHLMTEWLKKRTGLAMNHVPYRSLVQLVTELASGVIKVGWSDPSTPLPFVRNGKIRAIAISGASRAPSLPDTPTLGEQGHNFDAVGWFGFFAPAGTDAAIVKRLNEEVNRIQASPEMAKLMTSMNFEPPPIKTPAEFRSIVLNDLQTWKRIASDAHISIED